ncbi:hypothetical protein BH09SUM1_BH09SUM1_08770 [soil metagenome]
MSAADEQAIPIPSSTPTASRAKLLWFAALILLMAGVMVAIGLRMKTWALESAGPYHVTVVNHADVKLRADVAVENATATIEMEPEEFALLRFNPRKDSKTVVTIFRLGKPVGGASSTIQRSELATREVTHTFSIAKDLSIAIESADKALP